MTIGVLMEKFSVKFSQCDFEFRISRSFCDLQIPKPEGQTYVDKRSPGSGVYFDLARGYQRGDGNSKCSCVRNIHN